MERGTEQGERQGKRRLPPSTHSTASFQQPLHESDIGITVVVSVFPVPCPLRYAMPNCIIFTFFSHIVSSLLISYTLPFYDVKQSPREI